MTGRCHFSLQVWCPALGCWRLVAVVTDYSVECANPEGRKALRFYNGDDLEVTRRAAARIVGAENVGVAVMREVPA